MPTTSSATAAANVKRRRSGRRSRTVSPCAVWCSIRRRPRSSTARTPTVPVSTTPTSPSTSSATRSSRGGRNGQVGFTESRTCQRRVLRRSRPSGARCANGACSVAATRNCRIWRGCSIPTSGAGSAITATSINRRSTRPSVGSMRTSSNGRRASTSASVGVLNGPELGWHRWSGNRPTCSPIGSFFMGKAGCWEPYELRGSRTVLGARGGEIPPRDSLPDHRRGQRQAPPAAAAQADPERAPAPARHRDAGQWWSPEQIAGRLKLAGDDATCLVERQS